MRTLRDFRTLMVFAAVALSAAVFASCGDDDSTPAADSVASPESMLSIPNPEMHTYELGTEEAGIEGTLRIEMDGCSYLDDARLAWPPGTRVDETDVAIVMPDGTRLGQGEAFDLTGGFHLATELEDPNRCGRSDQEVFFVGDI